MKDKFILAYPSRAGERGYVTMLIEPGKPPRPGGLVNVDKLDGWVKDLNKESGTKLKLHKSKRPLRTGESIASLAKETLAGGKKPAAKPKDKPAANLKEKPPAKPAAKSPVKGPEVRKPVDPSLGRAAPLKQVNLGGQVPQQGGMQTPFRAKLVAALGGGGGAAPPPAGGGAVPPSPPSGGGGGGKPPINPPNVGRVPAGKQMVPWQKPKWGWGKKGLVGAGLGVGAATINQLAGRQVGDPAEAYDPDTSGADPTTLAELVSFFGNDAPQRRDNLEDYLGQLQGPVSEGQDQFDWNEVLAALAGGVEGGGDIDPLSLGAALFLRKHGIQQENEEAQRRNVLAQREYENSLATTRYEQLGSILDTESSNRQNALNNVNTFGLSGLIPYTYGRETGTLPAELPAVVGFAHESLTPEQRDLVGQHLRLQEGYKDADPESKLAMERQFVQDHLQYFGNNRPEIADTLQRYPHLGSGGTELQPPPQQQGLIKTLLGALGGQ